MSSNLTLARFPTAERHFVEVLTYIANLEVLNEKMETLIDWADKKIGAAERSRGNSLLVSAATQERQLATVKLANVVLSRGMDDGEKETLAVLEIDLGEVYDETVRLVEELRELLSAE